MLPEELPLPAIYQPYGRLRVYFGCMFSGKTDELHRSYDRAVHGRVPIQAFKPRIDTRSGAQRTKTRRGRMTIPVTVVSSARDILNKLRADTKVVILDEIQFFDPGILEIVQTIRLMGKGCIAGGLDLDYLARPFGQTLALAARANEAKKLTAICHVCRYDGAEYTQMIDARSGEAITISLKAGEPIFIEGATTFQARCGRCYMWPVNLDQDERRS